VATALGICEMSWTPFVVNRGTISSTTLVIIFGFSILQTICAGTATTLDENFDGVTPPALPAGWSADQGTNAGGFPLWQTSNAGDPTPVADTPPNSAFTPDPNNVLDNRIYSPTFTYTACARLSFRQNFDLEESSETIAYDCGVLEININSTGWIDIVQAGGNFETGGYNHSGIADGFGNPLSSRPNWSGNSGGFMTTVIQLPASGADLPVQLRWRMASDNSVLRLGWRIDSVTILPPICSGGCAAWQIAALGDFNRSSRPDYVLYNSVNQRTAIWYMNSNVYIGGAYGPTLPAGWELVATGDFNRDGKPDYVLYKASTGQTAIWYMNNNVYTGAGYGPTLPAGWKLAGVADFSLDCKPDYLLFNPTTLQSAIWYLSNNALIRGAYGPILPAGWQIVAVGDFNGDHKPDYVLYKTATRQTAIWYLNDNAQIGAAYGPTLPCN